MNEGILMKRFLFSLGVLWACVCGSAVASNPEAEAMIQGIGDQVTTLLQDKSLTLDQRADSFRGILTDHFNLKAIGKFVLGKYWRSASDDDKDSFISLFKEVTVYNYATKFQEYTAETFKVTGSRKEDDGAVMVLSEITRPEGAPVHVHWKIYEKEGTPLIYDVFLENVSMSITQRSEYASVIQKEGGTLSGLNGVLEAKVAGYKEKNESIAKHF